MMKKSFAEILQGLDSDRESKINRKLPEWKGLELEYPSSLSLEQCSSSAAAAYKAELMKQYAHGRICDLTGGLGVDSHAFAAIADRVDYFERNGELAAAAQRNFERLGIHNICVHNEEVNAQTDIPYCDIIFADPARRDDAGRKVFLLEDCSPDIVGLLPSMLTKAPVILLKLSPMADISMLASRFGNMLEEVHIVSLDGEVKELLCLLRRGHEGSWSQAVVFPESELRFSFLPREEKAASPSYSGMPLPGQYLVDPGAAMMKSGAFNLVCSRFGLSKLAPSTQLYTCSQTAPRPLFRSYLIKECMPMGRQTIKEIAKKYPEAEVSARNIHIKSEALAAKMGIRPGGNIHIFGCSVMNGGSAQSVLIVSQAAT